MVPHLIANLGAEEPDATGVDGHPRAETLAALWRRLFDPPAYSWLDGVGAAAWWNSEAAEREVASQGGTLLGAPAEVVRRVHDKAWALGIAREERLEPQPLRGLPVAFDAASLEGGGAAERLQEALGAWPAWARRRFTLKPRFGTSARGRVAGEDGEIDDAIRQALPRLTRAGGAVLEPWCDRLDDVSAQLFIGADGAVTLLGTLQIVATPAGVLRGHRGEFDSRGRPRSGLAEEESLREAAGLTAVAAAVAGYRGPCGIDAFSFRSPDPDGERMFRPLVEFNARFTAGTVAMGLLRRELPRVKRELGLEPGALFHFYLGLDAPAGGWPESGDDRICVALGGDGAPLAPGLLIARDRAWIDRAVEPAATAGA